MFCRQTTSYRHALALAHAPVRTPLARSLVSSVLFSRSASDWQNESSSKLREELKKRGLSANGNKSTLITRLVNADKRELASFSSSPAPAPPSPPAARPPPAPPVSQQQSRPASSSAPARAEAQDQFRARRSRTLDIKMPAPPEEEEDGPSIPSLPDKFDSKASESASPPQEPPSDAPKLLTVASSSTHISGGPTHTAFESTDAHAEEIGEPATPSEALEALAQAVPDVVKENAPGMWDDVKEAVGWEKLFGKDAEKKVVENVENAVERSQKAAETLMASLPDVKDYVAMPEVEKGGEVGKEHTRDMEPREKVGVWVLLGILGGGWLLGGVFAPSKGKEDGHHIRVHIERT